MNNVLIYLETQSATRPPMFTIEINQSPVSYQTKIHGTVDHVTRLICEIEPVLLAQSNQLCVIMRDKTDQDNIDPTNGSYVDHFISIKQVRIDDVDADAMLWTNSYFEHSMPLSWIENMRNLGHNILPKYMGNDIHLNGCMTFEFEMPFWLAKTKFMDRLKKPGNISRS